MTDLISRDALLNQLLVLSASYGVAPSLLDAVREAEALVKAAPTIKPQVVVNISGGLLQGASSTHELSVYVLDFDTDGCEPSELIEVDGEEARLGQEGAEVDPEFVRQVREAPTLDEECDHNFELDEHQINVCTECGVEGPLP